MLYVSDNNFCNLSSDLREEKFSIEWFEAARSLIVRDTNQGTKIHLKRQHHKYLQDGQVIFKNETMYVRINTLPCVSMVLKTADPMMVGDFCFDVGNRHLPVFCVDSDSFAVAYDARLFEALSLKFGAHLQLEELKLLPEKALLYF